MAELWQNLRVGDRVRVTSWPPELHVDRLHPDTRDFYEQLIKTGTVLAIVRIDELGLPWGEVRTVVDGLKESESVALNHGGLDLVP